MASSTRSILENGFLAQAGLLSSPAIDAAASLLERLASDDIETVRVLFADQHGILRGKTLVADALISAFTSGIAVPSTLLLKDTSHRTVFPVWSGEASLQSGAMQSDALQGAADVLLVPDAATFRVLPWSAHSSWLLCDVHYCSGKPVPFASRTVLKTAVAALAEQSLELVVGLELEFHIFELSDANLLHHHATMPAVAPDTRLLTQGYQLLTESRYDQAESILDEIRRCSRALGMHIRSLEVEMGPSQFEVTFEPDTPLTHADNMMMFRAMVKAVCSRRNMHATFMCRPKHANSAASGWHLHQSLVSTVDGSNRFMPLSSGEFPALANHWIGGLLQHAAECCLLTTPTVNGYKRYVPYQLAPDRIQWGMDNRGAMVRSLIKYNDPASRIENRVAEPAANPYYAFASQILAGLDGITNKIDAPAPVETPYDNSAELLPVNLHEAIESFSEGALFSSTLGPGFVDYMLTIKRAEWSRYLAVVSAWEQDEYFSLY
jgi:glutamine synthetase